MSFTSLDGHKLDHASSRSAQLLPAEEVYLQQRKGRRRHLVIYRMRFGYDWTYTEIADALQISRGHACRITQQVLAAIENISREINSPVALSTHRKDSQDDSDADRDDLDE